MRALVVYESMYGNTARIAAAIAEGFGGEAVAIEVGSAPHVLPPELELLVVGGPTHGHGMSQPESRRNAATKAETPVVSRGPGIREWLEDLRMDRPLSFATFDTRIGGPKLLWGSAADSASKVLTRKGLRQALPPSSFLLDGMFGSPYDRMPSSEVERARELGRRLASQLPIAATVTR